MLSRIIFFTKREVLLEEFKNFFKKENKLYGPFLRMGFNRKIGKAELTFEPANGLIPEILDWESSALTTRPLVRFQGVFFANNQEVFK